MCKDHARNCSITEYRWAQRGIAATQVICRTRTLTTRRVPPPPRTALSAGGGQICENLCHLCTNSPPERRLTQGRSGTQMAQIRTDFRAWAAAVAAGGRCRVCIRKVGSTKPVAPPHNCSRHPEVNIRTPRIGGTETPSGPSHNSSLMKGMLSSFMHLGGTRDAST